MLALEVFFILSLLSYTFISLIMPVLCVSFLLRKGASLSAVNCDGDVPLDIALDENTESLLQDYTLTRGMQCNWSFKNF